MCAKKKKPAKAFRSFKHITRRAQKTHFHKSALHGNVEQPGESEERLRVAMEAGKMGTWDWDMLTGEILWSPDHNVMYGIPIERRSGAYKEWLQHIHPHDREN